jgi:signal transduction histidine kinase
MSHELRTPLSAVLGFGQLLQMDPLDDRQTEYVDQILRGGRHLLELIDEVLDISRIEIGAVAISVEPVSVADVTAEATSLLEPLAAARRISLASTVGSDPSRHVMADRQRLGRSSSITFPMPSSTHRRAAPRRLGQLQSGTAGCGSR